jgi:hypothetical protein
MIICLCNLWWYFLEWSRLTNLNALHFWLQNQWFVVFGLIFQINQASAQTVDITAHWRVYYYLWRFSFDVIIDIRTNFLLMSIQFNRNSWKIRLLLFTFSNILNIVVNNRLISKLESMHGQSAIRKHVWLRVLQPLVVWIIYR